MPTTTPISSFDLLDVRALETPYPVYEAMRSMGPAVYLERHGVWAIPGFHEVRSILGAPDIFRAESERVLTPWRGRSCRLTVSSTRGCARSWRTGLLPEPLPACRDSWGTGHGGWSRSTASTAASTLWHCPARWPPAR